MAQSDLDIIVGADTRNLNRTVETAVRRLERRGVNLDTRKGEQALGRITGKADEFTKSLEASNARVIAFGASVAVIEAVRRSFTKLVSTIVEVESQLTSINSILGQSSGTIKKFGNELFNIAKNTGQSFKEVAQTAQEFARQGLSVEQTLQRTNDALILTRLTTLKTGEAVAALTASINGFEKQALSSTEIINKLRAVETSFAVSSDDLAAALSRSAAVAQGAGVSFEELLGVITAIKQRTGLGGATIGQGLKTVFTRLNLPNRIAELQALNVQIDESANGFEKLRQVAIAYKTAQNENNQGLATQIGVAAAGQFQIAKLSAAFDDLGGSYSVADAASKKALGSTNEAIKANDLYNQTISTLAKTVGTNIGQIMNKIGELGATDAIKTLVININSILEAFQGVKSSGANELLNILNGLIRYGKDFGVLTNAAEGFINVLTGPGLFAAAAIIKNLFSNTLSQGGSSLLQLTGLKKQGQDREQIQSATVNLLKQGTAEQVKSFQLSTSQAEKERIILSILEKQLAIQKAKELSYVRTAEALRSQGLIISNASSGGFDMNKKYNARAMTNRGLSGVRAMAGGNITEAVIKEQDAINKNVGGASSKAKIQIIEKFNYGKGKIGPAVVNSEETIIPNKSGDIVLNKEMMKGGILNKKGFNYAAGSEREIRIKGKLENGLPLNNKDKEWLRKNAGTNAAAASTKKQGKILGATAAAISSRGGPSVYMDTSDPAARRKRFQEMSERRNPVGRPSAKEAARRKLINRGASGGFESLTEGSGKNTFQAIDRNGMPTVTGDGKMGFAGFSRLQKNADKYNIEKAKREAKREEDKKLGRAILADEKAEFKKEQALQRKDLLADYERKNTNQDFESGNIRNFSTKDRARIEQEEYRRILKQEQKNIGFSDSDLNNSPEGKQLKDEVRKAVKRSVGGRFFEIDKQIAEQQVESAQIEIERQSKKGLRGKLGLPSFRKLEEKFKNDKNLTPMAKAKLSEDIENRRFARNQSLTQKGFLGGFALSATAPLAGNVASKLGASDRASKTISGVMSGAGSGLALGAMFGPKGAIVGGLGGAVAGGVSAFSQKGPTKTEKLKEELENITEDNSKVSNAINNFLKSRSIISELISSGNIDQKKLLNIKSEADQQLQESGLSESAINELRFSNTKDTGDIAARIQAQNNKAAATARRKVEVSEAQDETSVSRVGLNTETTSSQLSNIAPGIVAMKAVGAYFGLDNDTFASNKSRFENLKPFDENNEKNAQFKNIENAVFAAMDLGKIQQNLSESGMSAEQFRQEMATAFKYEDPNKAFEALGVSLSIFDKDIADSKEAISRIGSALATGSFGKGGRFANDLGSINFDSVRLSSQVDRAGLGQQQLKTFDATSRIENINSLRNQLSGVTGLKQQRSNIELANQRFGITSSQEDDNFNKLKELDKESNTSVTDQNNRRIFDEASKEIRAFINDPVSAGAEGVDMTKVSTVLSKMGDGISNLKELTEIKKELETIFASTENSSFIINDLYQTALSSLALEQVASDDRKEQLKISHAQIEALKTLGKSIEAIDQIGSEMGRPVEDILGRSGKTYSGVVAATSEFGNTNGLNEILRNEVVESRKGFITALEQKDAKGKFKIPMQKRTQMLGAYDRGITASGKPGSGLAITDVGGRIEQSLQSLEGKFSEELEGGGFKAFRSEVAKRRGGVQDIISSTPESVQEDFNEIKTPMLTLADMEPTALQKTLQERSEADLISRKKSILELPADEQRKRIAGLGGSSDKSKPTQGQLFDTRLEDDPTLQYQEKAYQDYIARENSANEDAKKAAKNSYNPVMDPTSKYYQPDNESAVENQIQSSVVPQTNLVTPQKSLATPATNAAPVDNAKPNEGLSALQQELRNLTTALSTFVKKADDGESVASALTAISEAMQNQNLTISELGTAIESLNSFKDGSITKEDLENVINKISEKEEGTDSQNEIQVSFEAMSSAVQSLENGISALVESSANLTKNSTEATGTKDPKDSEVEAVKVETLSRFVLAYEGGSDSTGDIEDFKEQIMKKINALERLIKGDLTTPS